MAAAWRARSASDKTDDWPFWYVTKDTPVNYNATKEAVKALTGIDMVGLPFFSKDIAIRIAAKMNEGDK